MKCAFVGLSGLWSISSWRLGQFLIFLWERRLPCPSSRHRTPWCLRTLLLWLWIWPLVTTPRCSPQTLHRNIPLTPRYHRLNHCFSNRNRRHFVSRFLTRLSTCNSCWVWLVFRQCKCSSLNGWLSLRWDGLASRREMGTFWSSFGWSIRGVPMCWSPAFFIGAVLSFLVLLFDDFSAGTVSKAQ